MKIILIISVTFVVLFGQNQNRLFWDGRDWKRVDQLVDHNPDYSHKMKAAYVNGVLDGRLFYYFKIWAEQSEFADSIFTETTDYLSSNDVTSVYKNINYSLCFISFSDLARSLTKATVIYSVLGVDLPDLTRSSPLYLSRDSVGVSSFARAPIPATGARLRLRPRR